MERGLSVDWSGGQGWGVALRTLASVGLVVALIVLAGHLLRYLAAAGGQATRSSGAAIRVQETVYLPAPSGRGRSALHLVEVGEHSLLVGATDTQLSLLAELGGAPLATGAPRADFGAVLVDAAGRLGQAPLQTAARASAGGTAGGTEEGAVAERLRRLRERAKRLEAGA